MQHLSFAFALLAFLSFFHSTTCVPMRRATYHNPIVPGIGADPWMIQHGSDYYLTYTTGTNVQLRKSSNIAQFNVTPTVVYTPANGSGLSAVWAPELHYIGGEFYIYVAMVNGSDANNHHMYALKGKSQEPLDGFDFVGEVGTPDNNWAIDGTVFQYENGELYFIWSGWANTTATMWQNLYIAKMDSPTKITGERVLIHQPNLAWQQTVDSSGTHAINEGPEILVHNNRTFLIYSAAASWTENYCLAMMGIDGGKDPLVASNWWTLDSRPVFSKSAVAFGPGHASFTYDHDGTPYIVYHAMADPNAGWNGRTIRTQTFGWNDDSSPAFPSPVGLNTSLPLPA
ncbi:glycoside hydrolase family 43 protein [Fomitopsis serialis]|uniref:glycoside hydrolase family 43 protein n=1 Tax=Fomitopsis serialis TaxID=139415 RepID=UPI002007BA8D|nr:glycoside hydrolase family 43 protein [Neoantrodia serialis]KAH9924080.1 glycoside hydrolase family 43 protein [Neoantrodia serialis]